MPFYRRGNMESLNEKTERVILAGVHTGRADAINDTTDESIAELEELVKTAGGEAVCSVSFLQPAASAL